MKLCKRCILQTDHMYELARTRECAHQQRNVTEESQAVAHRVLQVGQAVEGGIGGLAAVGMNSGVGVGNEVCDSARVLTTPARHELPQRVHKFGNTSVERIREVEYDNLMLRPGQERVEVPGEAIDRVGQGVEIPMVRIGDPAGQGLGRLIAGIPRSGAVQMR